MGVCVVCSCAAADQWGTDLDEALAAAKKQEKPVLVEFTGSDWCSACAVLKSKVLSTKEFQDFVTKSRFVPVELDYPNAADKVTPEQRATRQKIAERYAVNAYPTLLVLDAQGQPYGRVVGVVGSPAQHVERLKAVLDVRRAYRKQVNAARKLSGLEKAKALVAALDLLPEDCRPLHTALVDEVLECDTDDVLGYRKSREAQSLLDKQLGEIKAAISETIGERNFAEVIGEARGTALKLLEREDWLPFVRLSLHGFVSQTYMMEGNLQESLKHMDAAIAADPESPEAKEMSSKGRGMLLEMIKRAEEAQQQQGAASEK